MHEQEAATRLQLVEQRGQRVESEERASGDAGSGEAVEHRTGRERDEPPARRCDDLSDPFVVAVEQLAGKVERGRARDHRDVDPVPIEQLEPAGQIVLTQIDLEVTLGQLEPLSPQPRTVSPRPERADERLGPEVLVEVEGRQKTRTARQGGSQSKSKYFVRSIVTCSSASRRPGIDPLWSRTER
jgi:hypothetical protein